MIPVTLSPATCRQLGDRASSDIESEVNSAIEDLHRRIPVEVRRSQLSERLQNRLHSERAFHRVYAHIDARIGGLRAEIQKQMSEGRAALHREIAEARLGMQRQIAESQSSFQRDLWKHTIATVAGTALALLIALLAKQSFFVARPCPPDRRSGCVQVPGWICTAPPTRERCVF